MIPRPTSAPEKQLGGLQPTVFWKIAEDIPLPLKWLLTILSFVIPLAAWWILALSGAVSSQFLPTPVETLQAIFSLAERGFLLKDTMASCFRVGVGFGLASLVSIPFGIGMGAFPSIQALCEPIISFIRYMPAPAFSPLLIMYLGIEETPKIALIFIGTVFFNILMIMDAVKFIPKELLETTYTLGGNRLQTLFQVITPFVAPKIIDAFRVNMAAAWNLVVVAELLAATEGLGKRIVIAEKFIRTEDMFACLIILGLIGFLLDMALRWLLNVSCKWAVD